MKELKTKEDFLSLKSGEKIHLIANGRIEHWLYAFTNPAYHCEDYFIAISSANHLTSSVFKYPSELSKYSKWFVEYDSVVAGDEMVKQLKAKIDTITEIYIEEK